MPKKTLSAMAWLCIFIVAFVGHPVWPQKPPKRKTPAELTVPACCEEAKELKAQIANLSSLLSELSQKQERDWVSVVMQVMELESSSKRMESRLTAAESKFSEMNNQIDIMQLQAAQTVTQTSAGKEDACSRYSLPSPSKSQASPVCDTASRSCDGQNHHWGFLDTCHQLYFLFSEGLGSTSFDFQCAVNVPRCLSLPQCLGILQV